MAKKFTPDDLNGVITLFIKDQKSKCLCLLNGLCLCYKEGTIPSDDIDLNTIVPPATTPPTKAMHPWNVANKDRIIAKWPIWQKFFDEPQDFPAWYQNWYLYDGYPTPEEQKIAIAWMQERSNKARGGYVPQS